MHERVWVGVSVLHSWCFTDLPLFFWPICRLCTQSYLNCCDFVNFPLISYGQSFWPKIKSVTIFLRPLSRFESRPRFFFCVHIPSAIKVTKFSTILMNLWFFFLNSKHKLRKKKMTKDHRRVNCLSSKDKLETSYNQSSYPSFY